MKHLCVLQQGSGDDICQEVGEVIGRSEQQEERVKEEERPSNSRVAFETSQEGDDDVIIDQQAVIDSSSPRGQTSRIPIKVRMCYDEIEAPKCCSEDVPINQLINCLKCLGNKSIVSPGIFNQFVSTPNYFLLA